MKLIADCHVHTISSGHSYSTLEEYINQAKRLGLEAFAMTDHGPAMPGGPHYYHFSNMRMIPRIIDGVRVIKGIEANIINDKGEIDIQQTEIEWGGLELIMVAMHPRCGYEDQGEDKNTEVLIKALSNPSINVIAHPGNPKYLINVEAVVAEAKNKRVVLEINNSSPFSRPGSYERCLAVAKAVKAAEWRVVLGTDSHFSTMLGNFDEALKLAKEAGLTEEHIVNTSWEKLDQYILKRDV